MPHNFTWLVWEFVFDEVTRDCYLDVPYKDHPPVPKPFARPTRAQDLALRKDSAKAINKEIKKEWPKSGQATPPLIGVRRPKPSWPSRP
jgi:hypothetical protein